MRLPTGLRREYLPFAVAAALFCISGCDERSDVGWLPDESGFVYADKHDTRLVLYDLGKKARRVISEQPQPFGHAVSPDGKYFALARCEMTSTAGSRKQTKTVVITTLDRDGREQGRSKAFDVETVLATPAYRSETLDAAAPVCWQGHPDRLLTPWGIYDRKADRWTRLPAMPAVFVVPNCPPTARGFLAVPFAAVEQAGGTTALKACFVDWDGWASDFREPVEGVTRDDVVASWWDGRTWRLVATGGVYAFDTDRLTHGFTKGANGAWDALGRPGRYHRFAGTDLVLAAFARKVGPTGPETARRLELHSSAKGRRRVVHAEGEYQGFLLYPSPTGKLVAVRCFHPGEETVFDRGTSTFVPRVPPIPPKDVIVVYDGGGDVVATVRPE